MKERPCTVCKQPGNQPCVSLRTGKPIKLFHKDGRVLVIGVQRASDYTLDAHRRVNAIRRGEVKPSKGEKNAMDTIARILEKKER